MDDCQHCGGQVGWHSGTTTLIGKVHAMLCETCRTEWHGDCLGRPEYAEWQAMTARKAWLDGRATAGEAPGLDEWQAYYTEQAQLLARFFALGLAWLAAPAP
jgi:hypothetical protein